MTVTAIKDAADTSALPAEAEAAIVCRDLSKKYLVMDRGDTWRLLFSREPRGSRSFEALRDITLTVPKGEFVGILGRNGAGKSTLLRTVGGVFTPEAGFVYLGDRVSGLYELGIGGHDLMSGRRFVHHWLELSGEAPKDIPNLVEEVAEFTELGPYFDQPIRTYSSGMRARLFFATITAVTASIYLIDEVLTVGDQYHSAKCWRRLRQRLSSGSSGLLATHDWDAVLRICSHAIVLDQGQVCDSGPAPEVVRRYIEPPTLNSGGAQFAPETPGVIRSRSLEDTVWRFPINVCVPDPIAFGMSVESFRPGFGWQHILHVNPTTLKCGPGRYDVVVQIPRLPLCAGSYLINVFLNQGKLGPDGTYTSSDVRSWLYGNPITLDVEGSPTASQTHLEFDWTVSKLS